MNVLVTGASGFIGRRAVIALQESGHRVTAVHRSSPPTQTSGVAWRKADLTEAAVWPDLLSEQDAVLHLAGRAHVMREEADAQTAFEQQNVVPLKHLLDAVSRGRPVHVVFLSSIGVNGSETHAAPFRMDDPPAPIEPYAQSKLAAENSLKEIGTHRDVPWTIVRPPLVYGVDAPGNFARLVGLARSGLPLPLRALRNHRSLISVEHLASFLVRTLEEPSARQKTFLVSDDDEDVSTPQIIGALREGMGKPVRLFGMPERALALGAGLVGRGALWRKLSGSLQIDAAPMRELQWRPRHSTLEGLRRIGGELK